VITVQLSVKNILIIAGVLVGLWLLVQLWGVLLLSAVGLLIAAALMPYVDWLWRKTHNRPLAVVLVVLAVLAAVALVLLMIVPTIVTQGRDLWEEAPELQERAARFTDERGWHDLSARIREFTPGALVRDRDWVDTSRTVIGVVFSLFTVFFLAAYFLLDARRLKQFLYFSTPRPWHTHIRELLPALQRVVGGYIRGQAITSGAIFAFSIVLLTATGVPNPIALAAIAAVADLIPLIGVYILIAPMAVSALQVSMTTGIVVVGAMVVYQQFEDRVLVPRVYGQTLRLPTIAVVLALLAGVELLGLIGALLSLPVAAAIRVVVEYFAAVRKDAAASEAAEAVRAAEEAAPADQQFAPDLDTGPRPAESAPTG
jgi:predicted PurR-regulated permease PerM